MMKYYVVYDGNCNLCVTLVQFLENLDQGKIFSYIPMQDHEILSKLNITPKDCEWGMILIDVNAPEKRWQGSDAAEEIGRQWKIAGRRSRVALATPCKHFAPHRRTWWDRAPHH